MGPWGLLGRPVWDPFSPLDLQGVPKEPREPILSHLGRIPFSTLIPVPQNRQKSSISGAPEPRKLHWRLDGSAVLTFSRVSRPSPKIVVLGKSQPENRRFGEIFGKPFGCHLAFWAPLGAPWGVPGVPQGHSFWPWMPQEVPRPHRRFQDPPAPPWGSQLTRMPWGSRILFICRYIYISIQKFAQEHSEASGLTASKTPLFTALGASERSEHRYLPHLVPLNAQNRCSSPLRGFMSAPNGCSSLLGSHRSAQNCCSSLLGGLMSAQNRCSSLLGSHSSAQTLLKATERSKSLLKATERSKSLLKVTAQSHCSEMLVSATLSSVLLLLCSALIRAWMCTGSH